MLIPLCGKIIYSSRSAASTARRAFKSRKGEAASSMKVYHCGECGGFHIGRSPSVGRHQRAKMDAPAKLRRYRELTE